MSCLRHSRTPSNYIAIPNYLSVDGTGYDDPDSDGYSDYGTLGYYTIEASVEEEPDDSGDSGDVDDVDDVDDFDDTEDAHLGACSCTTGNVPWSGSLFLLSLFLVRRREPGAWETGVRLS